jgi:hypothetical protein
MKKSTGSKGKKVGFQVNVEPGSEVFIAGTFNNWDPRKHRMNDDSGSGHCKATIVLPPGRHEYKYIANGEWRADPDCPESVPNDQGSLNNVIVVDRDSLSGCCDAPRRAGMGAIMGGSVGGMGVSLFSTKKEDPHEEDGHGSVGGGIVCGNRWLGGGANVPD